MTKYVDILHGHYHKEHQIDLKELVKTVKSVTEFDTHVTSIAFGYGTLKGYYD